MQTLYVKDFNLKATIESGQIFRWEFIDGWYCITVGSNVIRIKQEVDKLFYESLNKKFDVPYFFGLKDEGYPEMLTRISSRNDLAKSAVESYRGLRILRQDSWECTASFICSSFSNIKRIRANLNLISENFGKRISIGVYQSYSFPAAEAVSGNLKVLESCGLGYRTKYLFEASKAISNGFDVQGIQKLPYADALRKITQLPGVGRKVADCILLFSLGFSEAFPVDVWMERIMKRDLGDEKLKTSQIIDLARQKFGKDAGYAQQFLYHYARNFKSVLLR